MAKCLLIIPAFSLLLSCQSRLELALKYAGENRFELEKVLDHYSRSAEDEKKYEAAKYLIENMPGHFFLTDEDTHGFFAEVDEKFADKPFFVRFTYYNLANDYMKNRTQKEDIHHITSGFLIRHIDESFDRWHKSPWSSQITFENFKKNVLPYRVGIEPLDRLMSLYDKPDIEQYNAFFEGSDVQMLRDYDSYIRGLVEPYTLSWNILEYHKITIQGTLYKLDCSALAKAKTFLYRYAAVPCAIDYAPVWARSEDGHEWNIFLDNHHKRITLAESSLNPYSAKIYRRTFHHNPIPEYNGTDFIPPIFRDPFKEDVTDLYTYTTSFRLPLNKVKKKPENIYLCVFNRQNWKPAAIGYTKNRKGCFENIGVGNIYLPIYYKGREPQTIDYPFYLGEDGKLNYLKPEKELMTVCLNRKYPHNQRLIMQYKKLSGLQVIGLTHPDSEEGELLGCISEDDILNAPFFNFDLTGQRYRYIKIQTSKTSIHSVIILSKLNFYDNHNEICEVGKYIVQDRLDDFSYVAFETSDELRKYQLKNSVIVDFGKEVSLSRLELDALNDDNFIVPGELYELLYHDDVGWNSLGRKIAESGTIEFTDVPRNALYWLRNHTKGKEERVFTYENDKMIFW